MSGQHTKEDCPFREDIKEVKAKVNQKEWYTNKQLYEHIQTLFNKFGSLENKLDRTTEVISEYNGLRDDLGNVIQRVNKMENKKQAKKENNTNWREWIGWGLAAAMTIEKLIQLF